MNPNKPPMHGLHLFLMFITIGLWAPVWIWRSRRWSRRRKAARAAYLAARLEGENLAQAEARFQRYLRE